MKSKIALAYRHIVVSLLISFGILENSRAAFVETDIGGGSDGAVIPVQNGYDVSSRSRDIGGNNDQFEFGNETRSGNFDVQARLEGITITDPFVQGGLMARESLTPGARFAGVFSSSALLSSFFESRNAASAATQTSTAPRG
ncbi:MAG TPA: hypothetical protein VK633_15805, partial [Verrucomicrobiae bacterium]|nr:hypothetical protein [Verrucomicrobiae bacterium]